MTKLAWLQLDQQLTAAELNEGMIGTMGASIDREEVGVGGEDPSG